MPSYVALLDDAFPLVRWAAADAIRIAGETNETVEAALCMLRGGKDG